MERRPPGRRDRSHRGNALRVTASGLPRRDTPRISAGWRSGGRSPGLRMTARVRPSRFPSGTNRTGLTAYSCGGSRGISPRSL